MNEIEKKNRNFQNSKIMAKRKTYTTKKYFT